MLSLTSQLRDSGGFTPDFPRFFQRFFFVGTDFCTFMRLSQLCFIYRKNCEACQPANKSLHRKALIWLVGCTIGVRWCMPLFLLASSVAPFTLPGSTPNSMAGSKVGLLPKTCDLRALWAIDKLPVSPYRRRWANRPPRKPNLTQHPQFLLDSVSTPEDGNLRNNPTCLRSFFVLGALTCYNLIAHATRNGLWPNY